MRHVFSHAGQGCKTFLNFCSLKVGLSHEIGSEALVVLQCANPPKNYSMLWNLYISCSASLRALRSGEPRGLQEKKMFWSKWHTLQGGHCAFSFPWVPSSLHQPNHRDDLEEDSLAIRPVSLFSPPLHLPLSLPPFSSFNPPPLSRTVWFIWPGWRQ